jgi:two-component system OmpR family response regulator
LLYKIKAVLARKQNAPQTAPVLQFGKFTFDRSERLLSGSEKPQRLSPREAELLEMLLVFRNRVLHRQEALKKIWGDDSYFNTRSMDVYVTRLRRRLKEDNRIQIETVYGTGFKLSLPD